MNNKSSLNIVLAVVIIILAISVGYFVFMRNTEPSGVGYNQNTNLNLPTNTNQNTPPATTINYQNTQYNFNFTLPASWTGYSIVPTTWTGWTGVNSTDTGEKTVATGPIVSIRHPLWTAAVPRQDIPVMVFTIAQWNDLQADKFHIGAAPIGPSELGRNTKYVFALPARYNFAYPVGFEEVDTILQGKPLSAF
jgi:hypothetical protein